MREDCYNIDEQNQARLAALQLDSQRRFLAWRGVKAWYNVGQLVELRCCMYFRTLEPLHLWQQHTAQLSPVNVKLTPGSIHNMYVADWWEILF